MTWAAARSRLAEKTRDFFGRAVVYTCTGLTPAPVTAILNKPGVRTSQEGLNSAEIDDVAWSLDILRADLPADPRVGDTVSIASVGNFEVVGVSKKDGDSIDLSLIEV